jgi:diguanylate cyclase (GGDEF)-like protein
MKENKRTKIAIIVEDHRLQDYIVLLLVGEGYEVKAYSSQSEALENLEEETVDLIISEFQSPNINGLDICKVLRKNFIYNLIPMFFLIPDKAPLNAARLIYAGADDYIKKSLIEEELFLKVKLNLYRKSRHQDIDNITRLPGQSYLLRELQKRIEFKELFAVSYVDLTKFKEFNHRYGFERGNAVMQYTASLIHNTMRQKGAISDFLAKTGSNDFIMITYPENVDEIVNRIIKEFDTDIPSFYDEEDKKNGFITIKDRNGETQRSPFLKIHIGVVINEYFPLFSPTRIIQIASEVKDLAQKNADKSVYIKEDRKHYIIS